MVCKHIAEALKKIDELGSKLRSTDPSLYEKLGPYVEYEMADKQLNFLVRAANEMTGKAAEFLKTDFIDKYGRAGRTYGCPAVSDKLTKRIINIIKNGSLLIAYYPDKKWLQNFTAQTCRKR